MCLTLAAVATRPRPAGPLGAPARAVPGPGTRSLAVQLRVKRSELMALELESVALRLFAQRGFGDVTVEEIAAEAQISARTFYRYFPAKEDLLQVRIDHRSAALRAALAARPPGEPAFVALRGALEHQVGEEDLDLLRRWIEVVAATPGVLRGVVGGIQLKTHVVMAEFFGRRRGEPADALVPTMLAAAAGGILQAAHTHWFFHGGDLAATISASLEALDRGVAADQKR